MGNSNISIRKTKDIFSVIALNNFIMPEDELNVDTNSYHWLASDKRTNQLIGFCSVSDYGQGILFLSRSGLLRSHRGRNIQRRFILIREQFAKRNGFKKIITYTTKDNYQSMNSLIKSGYQFYDPEYKYVGDDFFYFIKDIT